MGGNFTFTCVVGWKATVPHFGRCCTLARHNYHAQRRHNVAHGQSGATAMCGAGRVEPRSTKNMPYSKIHRSPHHITPQRGQLHRAQMLSPAVRVCRRPLCVRCLLCVCCLLCGVARSACVLCCNPLLMLLCSKKKKVRPVVKNQVMYSKT